MLNVLSIGNSFSQDAQRYVHQIARADKEEVNVYNLFIGGCPIDAHFRNMLSGERCYYLQVNGHNIGFKASLQEALLNREWDVITIQQASRFSFDYEKYQPYLNKVTDYVRECAPKAKLLFHQTWAYGKDSKSYQEFLQNETPESMLAKIKDAAEQAAKDMRADGIIPGGEVLMALLHNGVEQVHRDNHHASLGLGRYALGLVWYGILTGKPVLENTFSDFDEEVSEEHVALAKKCATELLAQYKSLSL